MFRRITGGQVGIVSKAYIADATPAAVCTHTSQRSQYSAIIEQFLNGVGSNYRYREAKIPLTIVGPTGRESISCLVVVLNHSYRAQPTAMSLNSTDGLNMATKLGSTIRNCKRLTTLSGPWVSLHRVIFLHGSTKMSSPAPSTLQFSLWDNRERESYFRN